MFGILTDADSFAFEVREGANRDGGRVARAFPGVEPELPPVSGAHHTAIADLPLGQVGHRMRAVALDLVTHSPVFDDRSFTQLLLPLVTGIGSIAVRIGEPEEDHEELVVLVGGAAGADAQAQQQLLPAEIPVQHEVQQAVLDAEGVEAILAGVPVHRVAVPREVDDEPFRVRPRGLHQYPTVDLPAEDFTRGLGKDLAGLRIGVPRSWFSDRLNEEVRASIDKVIAFYRDHGAVIVDMDLPTARLGVPVYYVVACAEASSNLSRYDGIRYGYRAKDCKTMDELIRRSRNEGLGAEPKRRIMIGTYVLSHGYYDAYYLKAQKVRRLIADEFRTAFASVDAIISPVAPGVAYNFGEKSDPVSAYLGDLYTVPASLAGLPCMSVPCGFASNGRPIGVQLTAAPFQEARLLQLADAWQRETDWHLRVPAGY